MSRGPCLRLLLLAAAAVTVAACSLTRLAYDNFALLYSNAAPMLTWVVDDYVDISGDQKEWVRERLGRALAWHRRQELPEYRRFLERVAARLEGDLTVAEVRDSYLELRGHYFRALDYLLPDVADFLLQLDPAQLDQLERRFEDENRKMVRESIKGSADSRLQERARKLRSHVEEWTGDLDPSQRELIEAAVRSFGDLTAERLADRRYRQSETLALLRANAGKEALISALRRLLVDTQSWRRPDYQARLRERDVRMFEMLAALNARLTTAQRGTLERRLRGYVRDITTLTASR